MGIHSVGDFFLFHVLHANMHVRVFSPPPPALVQTHVHVHEHSRTAEFKEHLIGFFYFSLQGTSHVCF